MSDNNNNTNGFNFGDRVRITDISDAGNGATAEGWILPENLEEGGKRLFANFVDPEPELEGLTFWFDSMLTDSNIKIELVATCDDQLPSEPGDYIVPDYEEMAETLANLTGAEYKPEVWRVDENGDFYDFTGDGPAEKYVLTAMGVKFAPYEG